jgi:hypothetical protein
MTATPAVIDVFCSSAPAEEGLRDKLAHHLRLLERQIDHHGASPQRVFEKSARQ